MTRPGGNVEDNKRIVEKLFKTAGGELEGDPFQDFASDCTYWLAGEQATHRSKHSGSYRGIEAIRQVAAATFGAVTRIESFEIRGMTAEGDRVAVEAESRFHTVNGALYNNRYHFLFVVRDGKIVQFNEYLDTALLLEHFG
jgi:ketosteroid isomerase-like protein